MTQHESASNTPRGVPQDGDTFRTGIFPLILTTSLSVYLGGFEDGAQGVGVALVTDHNVVNLALFQQHQGVRLLKCAL